MSKGLVHLNQAVESLCPENPATVRTEFRVFRCNSESDGDRIALRPGFIDDIVATHLLAAAALSATPELRALWGQYSATLNEFVETLPPIFCQLLRANYYEATGDPRDATLLDLLPIHRLRSEALRVLRQENLGTHCEAGLRRIRDESVRSIAAHFGMDAGCEGSHEDFLPTIAGPIWCPEFLRGGMLAAPERFELQREFQVP